MRQYAGYASAKESNERYRYLLSKGSTGLSMAFDLPTQLGLDSDNPSCLGEVGRTGVAIDTIDDMRTAFDGHPARPGVHLDDDQRAGGVPAAAVRARGRGAGRAQREATRHDPERRAQGVHRARQLHLPAGPTMRLTTDLFEYCHERVPRWNTISISGYHFREKGCSAVQEVAFTLSSGIAYVQAGDRRGACRSTSSRRGSRSSSTATTTSSRRSRSSGPRGGCGRRSCGSASAPPTRRR